MSNQRDNGRANTLLSCLDRCRSAPGSRLLAQCGFAALLAQLEPLAKRHEAVACLLGDNRRRGELRRAMDDVYDLQRVIGRIACARANARDLVHLASSLHAAGIITHIFEGMELPDLLAALLPNLLPDPELTAELQRQLVDEPPITIGEGGMIRDEVDAELDELRGIRSGAGEWLATYQAQQAQELGLKTLKVGYNKVFGYFIELGKQYADKVPASYVRKQTW